MLSRRKENQVVCLVLMLVSFIFFACLSSSSSLVAPKDPEKSPLIDYQESGENTQTGEEKIPQVERAKKTEITGFISSIVTLGDYVYACDASTSETIYVRWKFDDK